MSKEGNMKKMVFAVLVIAMAFGIQTLYADDVDEVQDDLTGAEAILTEDSTADTELIDDASAAEVIEESVVEGLTTVTEAEAIDETEIAKTPTEMPLVEGVSPLPSTYTVRTWNVERDCFWTIASYPFVYGDSYQWRRLYEANKSKLVDPENPNRLEKGTVLSIPSIRGESREGDWDSSKTYAPLP
jgi:nucleoid-associated protein YgaU